MTTFMQKLRVVTLGSVHDLLDKAIDMNSPSVLRQYVRDLEDALDKMKSEAAIQAGAIRTMERESQDMTTKIELGTKTIVQLQQTGHDDLARIKATEVVNYQSQLKSLQEQLTAQRTASAQIDQAVAKLETRHTAMVMKLQELTRLDMNTKAKESAASAMAAAGRLANTGADISVDDVESRMRQRNDVATERFNRSMGDVNFQEAPETTAAVDDLLASLKPKATSATN